MTYIQRKQNQGCYGHFTGAPPLPPTFSFSQNPAKVQALTALPPVAALKMIKEFNNPLDQTTIFLILNFSRENVFI